MLQVNLHGITKFYGGRLIFHELDFVVGDNMRIGLIGPNGAGKSTLLAHHCRARRYTIG